jgi:DNA polymerase (family X)
MNNKLADIFDTIADLLELKDENKFKISAYRNSARILKGLKEDVTLLVKNNGLENLKGFGKASIEKTIEYIETGQINYFEELKKSFPHGLLELFKIKGLGPKKIKNLWQNLGITNIGELEYACKENRLIKLDGFGEKTQNKILEGIQFINRNRGKFLIHFITSEAKTVLENLKKNKNILNIEYTGDIRRGAETYDKIEFLITCENSKETQNSIIKGKSFKDISIDGEIIRFISENGIPVILHFCRKDEYPFFIHSLTGSEEYLEKLNKYFFKSDIIFKDKLLYKSGKKVICKTENDIFTSLGIQYIPPEMREGLNEIELAKNNQIPKQVNFKDLKGALHIHSQYSDGINSIEEIAKECIKLGFEYVGICDHSKSAFYAHGLKSEDLTNQFKEIDQLNKKYAGKINILKGIESDILPNGDLDYDEETLSKFDFIVCSIHSNFTMTEMEMTARVLKAINNKYTTILGHPTGRLLLSRESYKIDIHRIIEECIKKKVIIELNSDEHRLDISWQLLRQYLSSGLKIAINSDAHNLNSFSNLNYGLLMAKKAGAAQKDIINCMDYSSFNNFLNSKK